MRVMNSRTVCTLDLDLMCLVVVVVQGSLSDQLWKKSMGRYIGSGLRMQAKWVQMSTI